MFHYRKLREDELLALIATQRDCDLSYAHRGMTKDDHAPLPAGFAHDQYRCSLGVGETSFQRAVQALRAWRMYPGPWTIIHGPWPDLREGAHYITQAHHFGFWSAHCCRVLYLLHDEDDNVRRFGFAIGTLPRHAECGEERFLIEQNKDTQEVFFSIRALSRPAHWMSWLGYPLTRMLQRRFGREAQLAMQAAVQEPTSQ